MRSSHRPAALLAPVYLLHLLGFLGLVGLGAEAGLADQLWDETQDTELSDDATAPTLLSPAGTRNRLSGTIGGPAGSGDNIDAVALVIASDEALDEVFLRGYVANANPASKFTFYLGSDGEDGVFLGTVDAGESEVGSDLLALAGIPEISGPATVSLILQENLPGQTFELELRLRRDSSWDELRAGDLSSNGTSPTEVPILNLRNQVVGSTGGPDSDAFEFTLAPSGVPRALFLTSLFPSGASGDILFELHDGPTTAAPLLTSDTLDETDIQSTDLIDGLSLTAGPYTVRLSDADPENEYSLELRSSIASAWDELVDGDLAEDDSPPTSVAPPLGLSHVAGITGGPGDASDAFTFDLLTGEELRSLRLDRFVSQFGNLQAEVEIYDGLPDTGTLLAAHPLGHAEYGQDLLSVAAVSPPNGPGSVSIRILEVDLAASEWDLGLRIDSTPLFADGFETGDTTAW